MNTKALVLGAFLALVPFAIAQAQGGAPSEAPTTAEAQAQNETDAAGTDSAAPQAADAPTPAAEAVADTVPNEAAAEENAPSSRSSK